MLLYSRIATPKAPKKRSRAGCNYCKDKVLVNHLIEAAHKNVSNEEDFPVLPKSPENKMPVPGKSDAQPAVTEASPYIEGDPTICWNTSEFLPTDAEYDSLASFDLDASPQLNDGLFFFEGVKVPPNSSRRPGLALIAPAVMPSSSFGFYPPAFKEFCSDYHHRALMNHFCNTLSHLIVLREDEGNPFQQLVLPLAHNSPAIRSAIYALASAHLERKGVQKMENDEMSIQFHSEAVCSLAKLIKRGDKANHHELLATIILLVYYEVLVQRRRSNLVESHLKGAMAIMRNGPSTNDRTSLFLCRAFRFYDVIAALSSGTAPVSGDPSRDGFTGFLQQTDSQSLSSSRVSVDSLLGLATSLWPVIHRLSGLLALKKDSSTLGLRARFDAECAAVESSLEEWQPMLPVVCHLRTDLERSTVSAETNMKQFQSIFNTALAYRHSAMVYLYRTIYDCPRGHPMVQHHTSISLVHCEATVRHEGPMGALLWPLFVASCEAVEPRERDLASEAFTGIGQRQGMTNIDRAWEVVQEVWNRADEPDNHGPETTILPGQIRKDLWRRVSEDMGMTIVFG
ncbi:hypothetical protein ED733_000322 [Metarhizium rileyi]|uniref:Fungal Zn binuclear cluster domain containing protein n=1 Tax=Metarhizium rileyi (strain RCEF 4871) TaxID=1649241 RepID=A0A5C6GAY9_METRR|nr:hypothetical protein ED733_000322 [Metarhizium rileyi]